MPDIKTREIDRTPKIKNAAARLPKELVRDITVKSADMLKSPSFSTSGDGASMNEDAGNRLEHGMEKAADGGGRAVWNGGKWAAHRARDKWEERHSQENKENTDLQRQGNRENKGELPETSGDQKELAIRDKQADRMRIKTREEVETPQGTRRSTGREDIRKSGKLTHSPGDRIKATGRTSRMGREIVSSGGKREQIFQAGKKLAVKGRQRTVTAIRGTKQTLRGITTAVKTAVSAVRSAVALISGIGAAVLLIIVLGVVGGLAASSGGESSEPLSQEVLAYTSTIQKYASQYGIPEYVASIQAIMMQESGGRGTDPMQASECPYNTRYPNSPGAIQDPEYSIQVGVQYYADCVGQAGCESPADMGKLQLSWQGYNYGNGYIGWALTNYGGYSLENALEFSQQQAAAHDIEGAIFEKEAVCEGYALAYKYYMNRLEIPCKIVSGTSNGQSHAWNQIQLNGNWYMVDPTWDDVANSHDVKHQYFLCSENKFPNHVWNKESELYETCSDTTYDNLDWKNDLQGMYAYQGGLYRSKSLIVGGKEVSGIWRIDAENIEKEAELVLPITDQWQLNSVNVVRGYSQLSYYDGMLYYNTPRAVWRWNFDPESEPEKVFELDQSIPGEIWDAEAANGKIYYETGVYEKGERQKGQYVFDEDYRKAKHPIAVTKPVMTVVMGGENVFLQSAAPGNVTYTSKNPEICDVQVVWKDESCQLIPKKAGETIVTVHADPTDHYAEGAVDVKVIVKERDDIEEKITLQYEAGDGGSIAAVDAATGKILENGAKIKPNAEVQFTASPNSGYSVKNWVVNGEVYKENGIVYTGMELKRAITASSDSVKVEFVKDEPAFVKGDVNLSGKVEIGDVREALRSICKKTELTALQKQAADVNENGNVDIEDLRKILRFVCGKIDQLNMEESGASK